MLIHWIIVIYRDKHIQTSIQIHKNKHALIEAHKHADALPNAHTMTDKEKTEKIYMLIAFKYNVNTS